MRDYNMRGLDQDLNRQLKYNRQHGGVSDDLKKRMRRPEKLRNGEGSGLMHSVGESLPTNKCKCGKVKFKYQKVCYLCNSMQKNMTNSIPIGKVK